MIAKTKRVRARLSYREGVKFFGRRAVGGFMWLAADRCVRISVALVIGSWSARYLGKADFGLLSYVMVCVAIFAAVAPLGMEALVVREVIRDEPAAGRWLGTVIGFRGAAAFFCALLAIGAVALLRRGELLPLALVVVLGAGLVGQSLESGELFFQARNEMRRLIVPRLGLFLVMNAMKVGLILGGLSVLWFAVLTALEQVLGGLLTLVLLRHALGASSPLRFEAARGWGLLKEAWPLALSTLSVIVYMKIGQVLLGGLLGDAALGVYAAAIRVSEAVNFLPMILASTLLPGLIKSQDQGGESYQRALLRYFRINALMAYGLSLPLCLGAAWIIRVLFGGGYAEAAPVMAVHVWSLLFVYLGVARGQHLVNQRLTGLSLLFSVLGLVVNLTGNVLLIPRLGVMGAAVATVLSYGVSALLSSFIVPATRGIGRLQVLALLTPWLALRRDLVAEPSHP